MSKFKAGDKAVLLSVEPDWGVTVGAEVTIKGPTSGSAGPGYLVELCDEPGSCIYYTEGRLGPVDDPLPPAPESVLYIGMQDYYRALRVGRHDGGGVLDLHIGGGVLGDGKSCILDPDSALQLAHDLTRMAMEIKRKEKQQERKTTLNPAIVHPYGE